MTDKPPKGLFFKILLAVLACTLGGVLFVGWFAFVFTRSALEHSIADQQFTQARQVMGRIDRLLYERMSDIRQIAGEDAIENFLSGTAGRADAASRRELVRRMSELAVVTGPWDVLFVVDRGGRISLSSSEPLLGDSIESYPAKWAAYKASLTGAAYHSDLVVSKDTGLPTVIFSAPIHSDQPGKPIVGVVMGNFSWPTALEVLNETGENRILLNEGGRVIGSQPMFDHLELINGYLKNGPVFSEFMRSRSESVVIPDPRQKGKPAKEILASIAVQKGYLSYKGSGWRVVLSRPAAEVFAPATHTATKLILVLIPIILLLAWFFLLLMSRMVFRPLERLSRSIRAIGAGDLSERVPVTSDDEIGALGASFNAMSGKLQDSYAFLEYKVAERTKELEISRLGAFSMMRDAEEARQKAEKMSAHLEKEIAERKKIESQLVQSQKMEAVGQLAGGIAHDFNNILTVINGYSELRLHKLAADDPAKADLQEILKGGLRAAELVNQLLAFSRRQVVMPRVVNLNELILDSDKMFRRLVSESIELIVLTAADLGSVKVDPGHLHQVLTNLIVNASHAMPEGGKILIETKNVVLGEDYVRRHADTAAGEYVQMTVSDTGTGMTEEVKAHIFEPFFTTKEQGKGTGLGLATTFGIVKQSGGSIEVYTELGKGTSFKIYLPRVHEPAKALRESERPGALPRGTETILVAEDEASVRNYTMRVLREQGYHVLEAHDGEEALRTVMKLGAERPVHLLITDMVMPRIGGKRLVESIRPFCPAIRVIFVSGYTERMSVYVEDLRSHEAFLQKPFSPQALACKVRQVLDDEGLASSI